MYRVNRQPELPDFYLPLGGKLDPKDRWVRVARLIPWHLIEEDSRSSFATIGMGAPARESCIACGALIIKALFGEIEEATVMDPSKLLPAIPHAFMVDAALLL
jgi:IS5 family transposase